MIESWSPTSELRWVIRNADMRGIEGQRVLQQRMILGERREDERAWFCNRCAQTIPASYPYYHFCEAHPGEWRDVPVFEDRIATQRQSPA